MRANMIKKGKKHMARPKNIYNKMPWRSPTSYKPSPVSLASTEVVSNAVQETPTSSLLAGKLSDGGLPGSVNTAVPKGSLAVYVGPHLRRYVVPTLCLSMPEFTALMDKAAEEYGYVSEGGLELPCNEEDFQRVLSRCLSKERKILGIKI